MNLLLTLRNPSLLVLNAATFMAIKVHPQRKKKKIYIYNSIWFMEMNKHADKAFQCEPQNFGIMDGFQRPMLYYFKYTKRTMTGQQPTAHPTLG